MRNEEEVMYITNGKGETTPLSTEWGNGDEDMEEQFTMVRSRKKKSPKVQIVVFRPTTRSQKNLVEKKQAGSPVHNTRATRGEKREKT